MIIKGCKRLKILASALCVVVVISVMLTIAHMPIKSSAQMPFYNLNPKELVVRSSFFTTYGNSSKERKTNIALACKALNNTFVDVGAEFSFNRRVGKRTAERGYKTAKIIVNGKFTEGVGGGVCQVSTTLYNALLLADLKITEFHPHSLPVSYVAPSFDAMVNSGSADLRFINNTKNPIIINAYADGERLKIVVTGQSLDYKVLRESQVTGIVEAPKEQEIYDEKGEFPALYEGESKVISYSKQGIKSQAKIIRVKGEKVVSSRIIRKDTYKAIQGLIVKGKAKKPQEIEQENMDIDIQ